MGARSPAHRALLCKLWSSRQVPFRDGGWGGPSAGKGPLAWTCGSASWRMSTGSGVDFGGLEGFGSMEDGREGRYWLRELHG